MSKRVSPTVGQRAREAFEFFGHWHGRSLWSQGPAADDITLNDRKLIAMFPRVNEENRRLLASL